MPVSAQPTWPSSVSTSQKTKLRGPIGSSSSGTGTCSACTLARMSAIFMLPPDPFDATSSSVVRACAAQPKASARSIKGG